MQAIKTDYNEFATWINNARCIREQQKQPAPALCSFRFFKKGSCQLLAKVCARSTG